MTVVIWEKVKTLTTFENWQKYQVTKRILEMAQHVKYYWLNYWHTLISKYQATSGFTSNTFF